jgi:hypothetical protein
MSSVFSKGQGRKERGTELAVADKPISAAAGASPTSKGLKEECCLNSCGVAQGHVQERVEAGIGMPV